MIYKYINWICLGKIVWMVKVFKMLFRNLIVINVIYFVNNIVIYCFIFLKKKNYWVEYNECERKVYFKLNFFGCLFFCFKLG